MRPCAVVCAVLLGLCAGGKGGEGQGRSTQADDNQLSADYAFAETFSQRLPKSSLVIAVVLGTRPEAIKLAPVVKALHADGRTFPIVICTGQHPDLVDSVLELFGVRVDVYLAAMIAGQSLASLTARVLMQLDSALNALEQDYHLLAELILVQGDTTSVAAAALVAYYHRISIGHVEAGLRTYNMAAPFPEELNRQLASTVTSLHFAPTAMAARRLELEGYPTSSIFLTGNTAIDSTKWQLGRLQLLPPCQVDSCSANHCSDDHSSSQNLASSGLSERSKAANAVMSMPFFVRHGIASLLHDIDKYKQQPQQWQVAPLMVLMTCHRRENFGKPMRLIFGAVKELLAEFGPGGKASHQGIELHFVFPVHPNPAVKLPAEQLFAGVAGMHLTPAMDFDHLAHILHRSHFVLTDSGGLQEEVSVWCKPVLVLRERTERLEKPEGVQAGIAQIVGSDPVVIKKAVRGLLGVDDDPHRKSLYEQMSQRSAVYGHGNASLQIVEVIAQHAPVLKKQFGADRGEVKHQLHIGRMLDPEPVETG